MSIELDAQHIRIRIAVPNDAPAISAVLSESFNEYRVAYTEKAFAATAPATDQIQSRLDEGPVWVALIENSIVGTVSVVPRGTALYIRGMAILPSARGLKLGELLLKQIENYASERGFRRLFLSTT